MNFTFTQAGGTIGGLSEEWYGVASSADGAKLLAASTTSGNIWLSTDSGATWAISGAAPTDAGWSSATSSADGATLIVSNTTSNTTWLSSNSGTTWSQITALNGAGYAVASSSDGSKLFAAGSPGGIQYSSDGGANWAVSNAASLNWHSIACSADGTKVVGASTSVGLVYLSVDSGATWTESGLNLSGSWLSVASSSDGSKLVASSFDQGVHLSTNSGSTWMSTGLPVANWFTVTSSSDGVKLAAANYDDGHIWTSSDSGASWIQTVAVFSPNPITLASSASGNKLLMGTAGGTVWTGSPPTIDGSNNTVTGTTTWGDGSSLILTTSGVVQAGATLTLNIPSLDALTGTGFHIEVQPGGSLVLGTETVVSVDGQPYRINGR